MERRIDSMGRIVIPIELRILAAIKTKLSVMTNRKTKEITTSKTGFFIFLFSEILKIRRKFYASGIFRGTSINLKFLFKESLGCSTDAPLATRRAIT